MTETVVLLSKSKPEHAFISVGSEWCIMMSSGHASYFFNHSETVLIFSATALSLNGYCLDKKQNKQTIKMVQKWDTIGGYLISICCIRNV